jgi:hypothetical protein
MLFNPNTLNGPYYIDLGPSSADGNVVCTFPVSVQPNFDTVYTTMRGHLGLVLNDPDTSGCRFMHAQTNEEILKLEMNDNRYCVTFNKKYATEFDEIVKTLSANTDPNFVTSHLENLTCVNDIYKDTKETAVYKI